MKNGPRRFIVAQSVCMVRQHFEEKWASRLNNAIKVEITLAAKVLCAVAFLQAFARLGIKYTQTTIL
jgi:hypothetical protein